MSIRNATIVLVWLVFGVLVAKAALSHRFDVGSVAAGNASSPSIGLASLKSNWRLPGIFHRTPARHNIAIIVDSTASMGLVDKPCGKTRLSCALSGVQTLLHRLRPCRGKGQSCSPAQTDALDAVSLFTVPNVAADTAVADYDCGNGKPRALPYRFPPPAAQDARSAEDGPTYQIVRFSTDYKTPGKSDALNPGSAMVRAVGGVPACIGMKIPGGISTYLAGAIYAAQTSLMAERRVRPGSSNILILIGDGDANTPAYQMRGATDSGTYPSWHNECAQAVAAAREVSKEGTRIYSVSSGAGSTGCPTDGLDGGISSPCRVMQAMASSPQTFFAVGLQDADCPLPSERERDLDKIFARLAKSIRRIHAADVQSSAVPNTATSRQ